jgi:hypothetical protein
MIIKPRNVSFDLCFSRLSILFVFPVMEFDLIEFLSGESIYRPHGKHDFCEGYIGVCKITKVESLIQHGLDASSPPLIKNLCGRFTTVLDYHQSQRPILKKPRTSTFGRHSVMHHLHGTVTLHWGIPYFKGCCGMKSIECLSQDLNLASQQCQVHMGVFKAFVGRQVQTIHGCFLENKIMHKFRCVRVCNRLLENCQAVKLRIDTFDPKELPFLTSNSVPTSVDITVTNKGVVILRFSWNRCAWNEETESATLSFCSWMVQELRECC